MMRTIAILTVLLAAGCDKTSNPNDDAFQAVDLSYNPVDLSGGGPTTPTCMPPGVPGCSGTDTFQSSPTQSGCFHAGTTPPGAFTPSYETTNGPCTGLLVVACASSPNCSFCLKPNAAIPPGCTQQ